MNHATKYVFVACLLAAGCNTGDDTGTAAEGSAEAPPAEGEAAVEPAGGEATEEPGADDQGTPEPALGAAADHSTPELVVGAIFTAAKTNDAAILRGLCDPEGEADGDVTDLCEIPESEFAEFVQFFANGSITGPAVVAPDGNTARVPNSFGPPDNQQAETIVVVKRGDAWFLLSV